MVAFAGVFAIAFWNFIGMEAATVPADDVVDAGRTIPRATIAGVLTCIGIYLLVALVSMSLIPAADLNVASTPLALVGARLAGPWGAACISIAALGSICAVLHYTVLVGGQAPAAAAHAGLFPEIFGRRSRRGTPGFSLVFAGILVTVLVLLNSQKGVVNAYRFMALLSTLTTVIPYAICAIAVILLPPAEGTRPGARRRAVVIAAVAFIVSFVVVAGAGMEAVYWTLLLLLAGLPLFALIRRKRAAP
jgi:APA family basic amino acid/polyamine antiporter